MVVLVKGSAYFSSPDLRDLRFESTAINYCNWHIHTMPTLHFTHHSFVASSIKQASSSVFKSLTQKNTHTHTTIKLYPAPACWHFCLFTSCVLVCVLLRNSNVRGPVPTLHLAADGGLDGWRAENRRAK